MRKEVLSTDKLYKAVIIARIDGLFEITYERWTEEIFPHLNFKTEHFWEPFYPPSLTDNLENAEMLAQDQISAWQGTKAT
jgi:hypothetical protein